MDTKGNKSRIQKGYTSNNISINYFVYPLKTLS